ncbi:hypothetical protein MTO96_032788 [Rhipicephalus appendiculatus]
MRSSKERPPTLLGGCDTFGSLNIVYPFPLVRIKCVQTLGKLTFSMQSSRIVRVEPFSYHWASRRSRVVPPVRVPSPVEPFSARASENREGDYATCAPTG